MQNPVRWTIGPSSAFPVRNGITIVGNGFSHIRHGSTIVGNG